MDKGIIHMCIIVTCIRIDICIICACIMIKDHGYMHHRYMNMHHVYMNVHHGYMHRGYMHHVS